MSTAVETRAPEGLIGASPPRLDAWEKATGQLSTPAT